MANFQYLLADLEIAISMKHVGIRKENVAFICMYKKQTILLRRVFQQARIEFEVLTVDSSRSKQWDYVVIDLVTPASKWKQVGFIGKKERLNVALSRGKDGSVVVGDIRCAYLSVRSDTGGGGRRMLRDFGRAHTGSRTAKMETDGYVYHYSGDLIFEKFVNITDDQ